MFIQKRKKTRSSFTNFQERLRYGLYGSAQAVLGYPDLKMQFEQRVGYRPDLRNPKTYNEKITWRKLYNRTPLQVQVSDKLRLRDYIKTLLGPEVATTLFPKLLGVYRRGRDIDFAQLPRDLVLKANHASGFNAFLSPESLVDFAALRTVCDGWMHHSYGTRKMEWAYQGIPRRILAEERIRTTAGRPPCDLKFILFGRRVGWVQLDCDLLHGQQQHIVDEHWQPMTFTRSRPASEALPPEPPQFSRMRALARKIGEHWDSIRVDFLFTEQRFWLNELTLYHGSGMSPFQPREYDRYFGDMWTLPRH